MPRASLIVPAHNVAATIGDTLRGLLAQTYANCEIIVVDEGSTDHTATVVRALRNPRIRLVSQHNRGTARACNTGIVTATGRYIGLCDADDLWPPGKLAAHVAHLEANPDVAISIAAPDLASVVRPRIKTAERPEPQRIAPAHLLMRSLDVSGAASVLRRAALDDVAADPALTGAHGRWFDERLRLSGDVDLWLRLLLTTGWRMEGIAAQATRRRGAARGQAADIGIAMQYGIWQRMVGRLTPLDPPFFARNLPAAQAYQKRALARQAIAAGQGDLALGLMRDCLAASLQPLRREPLRTLSTLVAALALRCAASASLPFIRPRSDDRAGQN